MQTGVIVKKDHAIRKHPNMFSMAVHKRAKVSLYRTALMLTSGSLNSRGNRKKKVSITLPEVG